MLNKSEKQLFKLKTLLEQYKQTKKIQTGLLRLSELTSSVTDLSVFYQQLQQIIQRYFPADNLYIQLFTQPHNRSSDHFYVDHLNCAPIDQQLDADLVEFISSLGKPVLINHEHVSILETDNKVTNRPFPNRNNETKLVDVWLAAPLIIENITVGLVGIKGFLGHSKALVNDLKLIQFIALHIASAILRNKANEQLKAYNDDIEDVIFDRTQHLQQSNFNLRKQVEERRKVEQQLYHAAHHDTLTKLPNRSMFTERLEHSLKHLKRHTNHRFAVLFIDLDRFKVINDTLGHHVGDQLLIQISDRIAQCIRGNDILARLGGDEFVILLDSLAHHDDAEEIALRIIETIKEPFTIDGQELFSSASIGIAICERNYNSSTEILRDADAAMYQAKALGRGRFVFFDDSMREELLANLNLEQELRKAVNEQQFVLHFQKINDLVSSETIGFEALLRWQHPKKGLLAPNEFLSMAEETGLITEIEFWVLTQTGKQLQTWDEEAAYKNTYVSVNLSGKHLVQTKTVKQLNQVIKDTFIAPERLIIEFNETAFSQNSEHTLKQLKLLKKTGVKLALDDYGSGISSLTYLNNYPFEFIKLDQLFVRSFTHNQKNLMLAKSLCSIGEYLGFRLIAEGIESQAQLDLAKSAGCEYGQGYFINKPQAILTNDDTDNSADIIYCA